MGQGGVDTPARILIGYSSPIVKLSEEKNKVETDTDVTEPTQEQKFLETQYDALRKEIEQASERAFKIFAASVLVVPTGLTLGGAVGSNVLPLIKMLLPLLLLAFYAMYWAQIFSTYRAGLYIRTHIEPWVTDREPGWESWLSNRRYAYDAQVLVAFILLSSVYYLGSVYFAVTAKVDESSALIHLKEFLDFKNLPMVTLLPDQVEKLSYELMLVIFYVLAGFVVSFLVQLTPKREFEEDSKMEQIMDKEPLGKQDDIQRGFEQHLECSSNLFEHRRWKGHIKHGFYYKDNIMGSTRPTWHMRLTIRNTLGEVLRNYPLHTLVALLIIVGGLWWAYMLIQRFYLKLVEWFNLKLEWLQPPGIDPGLIALPALVILFALLGWTYYSNIGKKLGAKVTIRVLPTDGPKTQCIVRTSLEDKDLKTAAENWVKKDLELGQDYTGVDGKAIDKSGPS
jgi:hypothetical protein